jgi:hypothetical protein
MRGTNGANTVVPDPAGTVAAAHVITDAAITSIQNNTSCVRVVPSIIERPSSGTTPYRIELLLYDTDGNMEAPDAPPTITLVNASGTDRSARLDSTTMSLISTGRYRAEYTATNTDDLEQLVWTFSVVESAVTTIYGNSSSVIDPLTTDFTATDRAKLDTLHDTRLTATRAGYLDDITSLATALALATVKTDTEAIIAGLGLSGTELETLKMLLQSIAARGK